MSARPEPAPKRGAPRLPSGTVTFVFTEIEGSTIRWERDPQAMRAALTRHDALMHAAITAHGGHIFKTIDGASCSAFTRPYDALAALVAAQQALGHEDFSAVDGVRVRAAIHTGTADERDADYFGLTVNRVARLMAIANGGQILVSGATASLVRNALPPQVTLRDLGEHRLKDLARPEHVFGVVAPDLKTEFPFLRSLGTLPNNLPLQLTSFVGRATEAAEIATLIGLHPIVTIVGSGGVGKTRISLVVGANLLDNFGDGVWFIELAPLARGDYLPSTVAQAMGIVLQSTGDPLASLAAALASKQALLIFDNCEHLVEPAARTIAALLRACPHVRILASTRQSLGISGETTYRLPSLGLPDAGRPIPAAEALGLPAVALFVERAAAVDRRFELTDDNAPVVAEICRRLDGIPLAIELAAARVSILSPRQLRGHLDERFRVLTGGRRDVLPRQQTLRALIDWSYDLLDARERALFRRLAVFVNGFTLDGAVAVGSAEDIDELDAFDVLASLVDKSLVLAEPAGDALRYRMLESTRAYAREKLGVGDELADSLARHLAYLRDRFADAMERAAHSGASTELDALLAAELEDVRAALDGAAADVEPAKAAELLAAIDSRWHWIGLGSEGCERLQRCIALLPAAELPRTSRLWTAVARIMRDTHPTLALEAASAAVRVARDTDDRDALANALTALADKLARAHAFDDAAAALDEAEALAPSADVWLRLRLLNGRAFLAYFISDLAAAADAYRQLRATYLQLDNASGANSAALSLAEVEHQRGRTENAVNALAQQLPALRTGRDRITLLLALGNSCGYLVALDRLAEARTFAREAFERGAAHDLQSIGVTSAMEHAALAVALDGDLRRAAKLAGYTQVAFERLGYQREYTEQTTRARLEALLGERLAPGEHESLLAHGGALSPDAAVTLAVASLDPPTDGRRPQ